MIRAPRLTSPRVHLFLQQSQDDEKFNLALLSKALPEVEHELHTRGAVLL